MKSAFSKFHLNEIRETVLLVLYESAFHESAFRESAFRESALSRKCTLARRSAFRETALSQKRPSQELISIVACRGATNERATEGLMCGGPLRAARAEDGNPDSREVVPLLEASPMSGNAGGLAVE